MLDTIATIFLYMSLLGLFCLGLFCLGFYVFWLFTFNLIEQIVDAVKWVVSKFKPQETDCYHCKHYDLANYWCNKHEDGRLMQETCEDGRRG